MLNKSVMNLKEEPEAVPFRALCYCRGDLMLQEGAGGGGGVVVTLLLVGSCGNSFPFWSTHLYVNLEVNCLTAVGRFFLPILGLW